MIYLKQSFDIHPASPATRDRFIQVVEKGLLSADERLGARLVGAWFCHEEWFSQILHVTEFDDLAAFGAWRAAAQSDKQASAGTAELAIEKLRADSFDLLVANVDPGGPGDFDLLRTARTIDPELPLMDTNVQGPRNFRARRWSRA